jgi:2-polyprenyl-3-methyl-5-hydroxy-6-metoxy-1,4-benzoquinol methylase
MLSEMLSKIGLKFYNSSVFAFEGSILKLLEENPQAKLLDLGCNQGEFTLRVGKKIGTDKVYGIEIDKEAVEEAKRKGIKVYNKDLNKKLPLKSSFADVIIANQVIEHLYDTDTFVKEIYRILKPTGYAIISTNNLASWHNIFSLFLGKQPFPADVCGTQSIGKLFALYQGGSGFNSHLRIFTYFGLKELFQSYCFKVKKIVGVGYYPFLGCISKFLSFIDKKHAVYLTLKVRK